MRPATAVRLCAALLAAPACVLTTSTAASGGAPIGDLAPAARPDFRAPWPCGQIRDYYHHASEVSNAIDFNVAGSADLGTPALASATGTVISAGINGGYGNEVVVDHGGGWSSRVAHLSAFSVVKGQTVAVGQELGKVGSTGNSSGPHLHYEQISGGARVPIIIDSVAMLYDGVTRRHTSGNCGRRELSNIAVYRRTTGTFYIRPANGGAAVRIPFGQNGDLPAPGHYENSPYDNLAVYRPTEGAFYIRPANGGAAIRIPFGQNGDVPAVGRYDNSSYDNLAVYRRSDASFYIRPADGGPAIRIPWGNPGDIPASAYYERGTYTNIATYRPATNTFYIRRADNTTLSVVFGAGNLGDHPAPGKFE